VDEDLCTGCRQCALDCPYDAITMLPRTDGRADEVARVDPDRCVSCGICAGSCAPMGVGPPGRTGRDQLQRVRAFVADPANPPGSLVAVACEYGAGALAPVLRREGALVYPIDCAGNLHSSVVELLLRGGMGGVLVLPCPERDCRNREGPRWLDARLYAGREAELQDRVDRRRVAVAAAGAMDVGAAVTALRQSRDKLAALDRPTADADGDPDIVCERPPSPAARKGALR
jgi:ferredoxin